MNKIAPILTLLLLLSGCSSNQTTLRHYWLNANNHEQVVNMPARTAPQQQLILRPITLSAQLARINLVYQLEENELHFAELHRWAGSLHDQLNQLTLNGLSQRLPNWVIRQDGGRNGPTLTINVEQFQGRYDGQAIISGRWRLQRADGTIIIDTPFQQQRTLPADGYNSLVSELNLGWQELLDEIAASVKLNP